MCLAIPAQIEEVLGGGDGVVSWSGLKKRARLDLVPEARVGDWVLVHAGYAMKVLDPEEARASLEIFAEIGEAEDD